MMQDLYQTLLLVDDDAASRANLADFLQTKGYGAVQASSGRAALDQIRQYPVHMIISTQKMPDMDGIDLCRLIRNKKRDNYIYFIMLTPNGVKEERVEGYRQGVDSYLETPYDPDELEALIQAGMRITAFKPAKESQKTPEQAKIQVQPPRQPKEIERELSKKMPVLETRNKNGIKKEDIDYYDILLARIALEHRLLTKEQLAKAFSFQKKESLSGKKICLDEIFLEKEMIPLNKMDDLNTAVKQRLEKKFGWFTLKKGYATQEQVDTALAEQAGEFKATQSCRLTGDILVANGAITKEQRDSIRCEMKGLTPAARSSNPLPEMKSKTGTAGQQNISEASMFHLVVSPDKLEARIQLKKGFFGKITLEDINTFLNQNGLQAVIADFKEIEQVLNATFNENPSVAVAKGKPPLPGCDASIVYHFDIDHLKAGTVNEDGKMNYRERGRTPRVQKGDLLATKIPMQDSLPGIDIYFKPIPAPAVKDVNFKCGEGTCLSEDGLNVYATIDGQPTLALGGMISVYAELTIDGDVGFNTGNIDFDGNVNVKGTIMNGFSVRCGNLFAKEIVDGKIVAMGDVTVPGGIIRSDIKTEGNVKAKFITDSNIKSFGSVVVEKEVINSKIRSSAKFVAERGKIISSFISAKMGFESKEIGTDVSSPCRINVGMDENVKKRIQAFNYSLEDKKKALEAVQKQYEKQSKNPAALFFQNREMLDEKAAQDLAVIETIIKEIETIGEEKEAIVKWSKDEKGVPVIKVTGSIRQGTQLFGIHSSLVLRETICNVTIKEIKQTDLDFWRMTVLESK